MSSACCPDLGVTPDNFHCLSHIFCHVFLSLPPEVEQKAESAVDDWEAIAETIDRDKGRTVQTSGFSDMALSQRLGGTFSGLTPPITSILPLQS